MMDAAKLPKSGMDRETGADRATRFRQGTQGKNKPMEYGTGDPKKVPQPKRVAKRK